MAHSLANCRFDLAQSPKRSLTASMISSSVGKCRLWVAKRRASFHTRSTGLSSGLYGGKNNSVSCSRCWFSQGSSARAWWYLALSSTSTKHLPRERCLSSSCKKRWKDSPLNFGSKSVTSLPVPTLTAPKQATDLRVGACSTIGSVCSGGTHMRQRVPCCWKWHSSELHRSTLRSATRRRSFFKGSLRCRVGLGDNGARFAQPEAHLPEQALALAYPQLELIVPAQVLGQQHTIPQRLRKPKFARTAPQIALQALPVLVAESSRSSRPLALLQSGKADLLEAVHPALHRALALTEPQRRLSRAHAVSHQQDSVQSVIVPRLVVALDLLTYGNTHHIRVADFQLPHNGTSHWRWRCR